MILAGSSQVLCSKGREERVALHRSRSKDKEAKKKKQLELVGSWSL